MGADPNARGGFGENALSPATRCENTVEMVHVLLQGGTDPNAQAACGLTVLHEAGTRAVTEVVETLLLGGADPNVPSDTGLTVLHFAMHKGRSKTAELLKETGAEI